MSKNHLSYFEVSNFKRFENLKVDDIGQINLVVGRNNVGKTSLLEALLFSEDRVELLKNYHKTLCYRELHIHPYPEISNGEIVNINFPKENFLNYIFKNIERNLQLKYSNGDGEIKEIKLETLKTKELTKEDNEEFTHSPIPMGHSPNDWIRFYRNDELKEVDWLGIDELLIHDRYIPFIPMNRGYRKDLVEIYANEVQKSKSQRKSFKENLKILIPEIEEILLSKINERDILSINIESQDSSIPLTNMGDGVVRLARILLEITQSKDSRLMIDEASIGIHHSKLVEFWSIVIKACLRNNVQLFASTHSYESLECFIRATEKYTVEKIQDKIKCIQVTDTKQEDNINVKTITFSYEEFETILSLKNEIRD